MIPTVVIQPVNGLINRLQAIASGLILAQDLGAACTVDWEPENVAPVSIDEVFDPSVSTQLKRDRYANSDDLNMHLRSVQPYLHFDRVSRVVSLAGFDKGEQAFMPALKRLLELESIRGIVIRAGGKFYLPGSSVLTSSEKREFEQRRQSTYHELALHPTIRNLTAHGVQDVHSYGALHLRYSDRSMTSPWRSEIRRAVTTMMDELKTPHLLITGDDPQENDRWYKWAEKCHFRPFRLSSRHVSRNKPAGVHVALADWLGLSGANSLVYFASSSFGEEAAVAGGLVGDACALEATYLRRTYMSGRQAAIALSTYPRRHGWI